MFSYVVLLGHEAEMSLPAPTAANLLNAGSAPEIRAISQPTSGYLSKQLLAHD